LCVTDGPIAGTTLVKDISAGQAYTYIEKGTLANGICYFTLVT